MRQISNTSPKPDNTFVLTLPNNEISSENRSQEVAYHFPILFQHYFNFEATPIQNARVHQKGGIE